MSPISWLTQKFNKPKIISIPKKRYFEIYQSFLFCRKLFELSMRHKKIRSHEKIWKEINNWEQQNLDLGPEEIRVYQRKYLKVRVSPYCDYDLLGSEIPEPRRKTRQMILESLLNIYHSWRETMEKLEEPYYLKIWLYEPQITQSQIVCALGDFIGFYETAFYQPEIEKEIDLKNNYSQLVERMGQLTWDYAPYEQGVKINDIGEPYEFKTSKEYRKNKRSVKRKIQNAYRTKEGEDGEKFFFSKRGAVWIGGSEINNLPSY